MSKFDIPIRMVSLLLLSIVLDMIKSYDSQSFYVSFLFQLHFDGSLLLISRKCNFDEISQQFLHNSNNHLAKYRQIIPPKRICLPL